ncbi:MAG: hypothetical protein QXK78_00970 [Candidatus Bathyarchaeia archaeon]
MVVAGKVFRLLESLPLNEVAFKLDGYKMEDHYEENNYRFNLISEVVRLSAGSNAIKGIYSHDYVTRIFHRGQLIPTPKTIEALFNINYFDGFTLLTVVERKRLANFIANKLSEVIFGRIGGIVEARISPEALKAFHMKNPEDTKIVFFDNVDIPNVDKLSLYGPDLMNTSIFEEYCKRGDLWYIVARDKKYGYVIGVTRDASITIFNISDRDKYLEYVTNEIYPLILKSSSS